MSNQFHPVNEEHTMSTSSLRRIASAAVVTSAATLTFAAPASALVQAKPDPGPGGPRTQSVMGDPAPTSTGSSWDFLPVASGALGGVVVAGLGAAAAAGVRRRHQGTAFPA